ncbi:MAG TPA: type 4a pilus biogenesis protein PilO [bacterium]|jgi:Tfp pilus assembly protein PilO
MSRRERILVIVGLGLVLLLGYYYYIYSPKQAEYQQLTDTLADRQSKLDQMQRSARQARQLEAQYTELQAFIAAVEAKLPAGKDVPVLLVELERATRGLGIELVSIKPSALETVQESSAPARPGARAPARTPGRAVAPAPAGAYSRFPIKLLMTASYAQVLRLMSTLQDFPRLILVKRLTVAPRSVPKLSVDLDVETYVLAKEAR